MKEIGGYIELDISRGEEYHKNAVAVNSGRHALEYIIRAKKIRKLYIPYYLCASIRNLCEKCDCEYEFYSIKADFSPDFNKKLAENEYLYIVNYYGQMENNRITGYKNIYKNIIVDNAQAFFQMPVESVDTIYTCRKFFGVSDGGYVYTNTKISENLDTDKSYERIKYVLGRFETDAGTFYKEAAENNKFFATESLRFMSKLTHNLLKGIDYNNAKKKRTENFEYLHERLKKINKLDLNVPEGAFMYPLYVGNGEELKKKLIENKIFVPTLWKDTLEVVEQGSVEWDYTENIVPLPIDQRYDIEDMKYIVKVINSGKKCN
ncbi:MAG: hypothetical protein J6C16_03215 [Clostridia bacterium]|nr:hypothetical protein [Clostridia bacterium]